MIRNKRQPPFAIRAALCAAALASACALSSCSRREKRASLFLYTTNDPFISAFADQIRGLSAGKFSLQAFDADNSQIIQNEQIEAAIKKHPDLMIINPVDRLGMYPIINKLKQEGVPVVFFNREPLLEDLALWDRVYYVGARAEQSSQIQASLVMELFGNDPRALNRHDRNADGRIQAVILKGEQGHQDAEIRTAEAIRSFQEGGYDLDILTIEIADWNRDIAYDKMEGILDAFQDRIELVLSNNDAMALGAIQRMKERGIFRDNNGNGRIDSGDSSWIPVVGIDGLDDAVLQIQAGYLYGTVVNDSIAQSRAIVDLSSRILEGRGLADLSLEDGKYIWVEYKRFTLD